MLGSIVTRNSILILLVVGLLSPSLLRAREWVQGHSLSVRDAQIAILTQDDIAQLKPGITARELIALFGEPFGTTLPQLLQWPKYREFPTGEHESEKMLPHNDYCFLLERGPSFEESSLILVASYDTWQDRSDKAIVDQLQYMSVNWPPQWVGKTVEEYFKVSEGDRQSALEIRILDFSSSSVN